MTTLQQSVKNLEELFDIFNEVFYKNELEKPIISIQSDAKRGAYGWCTTYKAWESSTGEEYYEINLCAEYLGRGLEEICGTLLHEMAHLYNLSRGVSDCNRAQYHNKEFKKAAEDHGLIAKKVHRYGWAVTKINDEAKQIISKLNYTFDLARKTIVAPKVKKKNPTLKYACPCCKTKIYSIKPLNVTCDDCGKKFIQYA